MRLPLGQVISFFMFWTKKTNLTMTHIITSNQRIDNNNSIIVVQLNPDNEAESNAIRNTEQLKATDEERDIVENYLHFSLGLGRCSVVSGDQSGNTFTLRISRV